jgi:hypothetical protein
MNDLGVWNLPWHCAWRRAIASSSWSDISNLGRWNLRPIWTNLPKKGTNFDAFPRRTYAVFAVQNGKASGHHDRLELQQLTLSLAEISDQFERMIC